MTPIEHKKIISVVKQTNAIMALEGFVPDAEVQAMQAALIAGQASPTQLANELVAYVKAHKTSDGFMGLARIDR